MVMWRRLGFLLGAWAFLLTILVQVFWAGMAIFEDAATYWPLHGDFGYVAVHGAGAVMLVFALISKLPRALVLLAIVTFVLVFFMPGLAVLGSDYGILAALHPVAAIVTFGLGVVLAVRARAFAPPPWGRGGSLEGPS